MGECKQRSVGFSRCAVKEQRLFARPIKWPPDAYSHHLSHCATYGEEKKEGTVLIMFSVLGKGTGNQDSHSVPLTALFLIKYFRYDPRNNI